MTYVMNITSTFGGCRNDSEGKVKLCEDIYKSVIGQRLNHPLAATGHFRDLPSLLAFPFPLLGGLIICIEISPS